MKERKNDCSGVSRRVTTSRSSLFPCLSVIRVNILFTNEYCEERRTLTSKQRSKWRSQCVNPAGRVCFDILTDSIYLISRKMEKTNIFSYFLENWIEKNCVHNALNTEDRERIKV